jgi:hypothetical protein
MFFKGKRGWLLVVICFAKSNENSVETPLLGLFGGKRVILKNRIEKEKKT